MVLDDVRLEGRVALVSGGNRGLGQGCAVALAEAGAHVALLGRTHPVDTMERISDLGRGVAWTPCDLATARPADLRAAVTAVTARWGHLDILVNNAGIIRRAPAVEHTTEDWDEVMTVDIDAVFHLSQAASQVMVTQGGGKIINIASMLSFQGGLRVPAYAAAKHAVVGLTKALANEWAAAGVNVNAI